MITLGVYGNKQHEIRIVIATGSPHTQACKIANAIEKRDSLRRKGSGSLDYFNAERANLTFDEWVVWRHGLGPNV